jgi:hypothetical protein
MSIHEPATLLTDYLLALLGAVLSFPHFVIAIVDYGLAMLSWAGAALYASRPWRGWILTAVALSATAVWVQQSGFSWSTYLNHNDLFHLIQALALIGFFRAAKLMRGCRIGGKASGAHTI